MVKCRIKSNNYRVKLDYDWVLDKKLKTITQRIGVHVYVKGTNEVFSSCEYNKNDQYEAKIT